MFVRAENRSWSVYGKFLSKGEVAEISEEQLPPIQRLIDSGELSLHERDPRAKKAAPVKAAPKKAEPVKVEVKEEAPEPPAKKTPAKKTRRRRAKKEG